MSIIKDMANEADYNSQVADRVGVQPPTSSIGNEKLSLDRVVQDHLDDITRLAHRLMGWQGDVEDIVQDVFLSAAQKLDHLRNTASVRAWLFQITINKCRTHHHKQRFQLRFLAGYWRNQQADTPQLPEETDGPGKYAHIRRAVKNLPAKYREAVVLRYLEQMPQAQAAAILGIRENTLNVRLMRARAMLRDNLKTAENEI